MHFSTLADNDQLDHKKHEAFQENLCDITTVTVTMIDVEVARVITTKDRSPE